MNRFSPKNRRNPSSEILSRLWAEFPAERESLRPYADRAKSYRNDCGCAMGGKFTLAALAGLILYGFAYHGFRVEHWLLETAKAVGCLWGAALLGKLTGIGLARIRLARLGRELRSRYRMQGG
jgi:hypothetical protein